MRRTGLLVTAVTALWVGAATTATATAPRPAAHPAFAADELTALPAAALPTGTALRTYRDVTYGTAAAPAAWAKFAAAAGGTWSVSWDRATHVPTRIWGSGILAPGALASPELAALVARAWLANHIALLAPGAAATDFTLVSNVSDGDLRAIGFVQTSGGARVIGGQISFEFKRDRLFVIGSTALPNVGARLGPQPRVQLSAAQLRARAITAVTARLSLPATAVASALGDQVIVPLVGSDAVLGYRVAAPLTLDARADGKYLAYVDPASGEPIAVRQQNLYDAGTLVYTGVDRYPGRGRTQQPAPLVHATLQGTPVTTGHTGVVPLPPGGGQYQIEAVAVGDLVLVHSEGSGAEASGSGAMSQGSAAHITLPIITGASAVWDASDDIGNDAQVVTYLAINTVKDFVRANVDDTLAILDQQITANVNLPDVCNAFFDGTAVNFFEASTACQNTGRINDVMFHEFGHDVHISEIIPGVGLFDGAMSEGVADTLAVNITNDSGLGRGFYYTDAPLRELNPEDHEAMWPRDIGEIHTTGLIIGGTLWDLRASLLDALGPTDGEVLFLKLYVGALRRSVDIPSTLVEVLATDDDDGDLSNGTPHECLIRTAYGNHGMHTATGAITGPAVLAPADGVLTTGAVQVRIDVSGLVDRCHADDIANVTVAWGTGAYGIPARGSIAATQVSPSEFLAQLPLPLDGAGSYNATINFVNTSTIVLPDNRADPAYTVYQANTVKLYCTDFETEDPFATGWKTAGARGSWQWIAPPGGGTTDPQVAFSGSKVLMQSPGSDYEKSETTSVTMPRIDTRPYSDVRLQYRRWLAVDDSAYDQARITANGARVWENTSINQGDTSALPHIDKEWRFQDVPLSGLYFGSNVEVGWDLKSNGSVQYGGWAIDDVCLVANPDSICGDGVRQPFTEQCDDGAGNSDTRDACRTDCDLPSCGDGIVDTGEECDEGPAGTATCSTKCKLIDVADGGCAVSSGGGSRGGAGAAWLLGLAAAVLSWRRGRSPSRRRALL